MADSCAAIHCLNRRCDGDGVRFHKFPLHDKSLCEKWIAATKRHNVIPKDYSYICEKHFTENDYEVSDGCSKQLRPDAVPTVFRSTPLLGKRRTYGTSKYPYGLVYSTAKSPKSPKTGRKQTRSTVIDETVCDSGLSSNGSSTASSRKSSKNEDEESTCMEREQTKIWFNETPEEFEEVWDDNAKVDTDLAELSTDKIGVQCPIADQMVKGGIRRSRGKENCLMVRIQEYEKELSNVGNQTKKTRPLRRGLSIGRGMKTRKGDRSARTNLRRSNSLNIERGIDCLIKESMERQWNKFIRFDRQNNRRNPAIRQKNDLYDSVTSLLNSRREKILNSLEQVRSDLQLIELDGAKTRKTMHDAAQKLLDLNQELGHLKNKVGKLSQQTSTLKDVTVFADKSHEKELLVQATEDLDTQYEHCVKDAVRVTSSIRSSILEYFCEECRFRKQKIEEYGAEIPSHNADEEDLSVLKEILLQDQRIMEKVKDEKFYVDDLKQFAEEISVHDFLTRTDQNAIIDNIKVVHETIHQFESQGKENTNRVYAVTMHIYHDHIHRITEEVERVMSEANKKMRGLSNVEEFNQAIDILLSVQKLRDRVKDLSSQISMVRGQIKEWEDMHLVRQADANRLKEEGTYCVTESLTASKDVENLIRRVESEIRAIVMKRASAFWTWLPTAHKQGEKGHPLGPTFDAVTKEIEEMKVIQVQASKLSFSDLLDPYKTCDVLEFLTEDEQLNLKSGNDEWMKMKKWVDRRLDMLSRIDEIWNDFKARKMNLGEYLSDVERELEAVTRIELNDNENMKTKLSRCLHATEGMETRKDDASRLTETADKLINLLTSPDGTGEEENTLANSIRSQVSDVLDRWNTMVKRSIKIKSKLHDCVKKFESCCKLYQDVRNWVDDCTKLLSQFTVDTSGEHIDAFRLKLEKKQGEVDIYRQKFNNVHKLDGELSREGEVQVTYALPGKLKVLKNDFRDTAEKLDELRKLPGQVKMLSRRVCGGAMKLTRSLMAK